MDLGHGEGRFGRGEERGKGAREEMDDLSEFACVWLSFCFFSPVSLICVCSIGDGVHGFTLDPSMNEFILTKENVRIPFSGHYYSINEGHTDMFEEDIQEMLIELKVRRCLCVIAFGGGKRIKGGPRFARCGVSSALPFFDDRYESRSEPFSVGTLCNRISRR